MFGGFMRICFVCLFFCSLEARWIGRSRRCSLLSVERLVFPFGVMASGPLQRSQKCCGTQVFYLFLFLSVRLKAWNFARVAMKHPVKQHLVQSGNIFEMWTSEVVIFLTSRSRNINKCNPYVIIGIYLSSTMLLNATFLIKIRKFNSSRHHCIF